jgi:hypothetical protein
MVHAKVQRDWGGEIVRCLEENMGATEHLVVCLHNFVEVIMLLHVTLQLLLSQEPLLL